MTAACKNVCLWTMTGREQEDCYVQVTGMGQGGFDLLFCFSSGCHADCTFASKGKRRCVLGSPLSGLSLLTHAHRSLHSHAHFCTRTSTRSYMLAHSQTHICSGAPSSTSVLRSHWHLQCLLQKREAETTALTPDTHVPTLPKLSFRAGAKWCPPGHHPGLLGR